MPLPGAAFAVECVNGPGVEGANLMELLGMGARGAFGRAVGLGRAGRRLHNVYAPDISYVYDSARFLLANKGDRG